MDGRPNAYPKSKEAFLGMSSTLHICHPPFHASDREIEPVCCTTKYPERDKRRGPSCLKNPRGTWVQQFSSAVALVERSKFDPLVASSRYTLTYICTYTNSGNGAEVVHWPAMYGVAEGVASGSQPEIPAAAPPETRVRHFSLQDSAQLLAGITQSELKHQFARRHAGLVKSPRPPPLTGPPSRHLLLSSPLSVLYRSLPQLRPRPHRHVQLRPQPRCRLGSSPGQGTSV